MVIGGIAPTTFQDIATLAGDARLVDEQPLCVFIYMCVFDLYVVGSLVGRLVDLVVPSPFLLFSS